MIIQHNISALLALNSTNKSTKALSGAKTKLSSGFKINSAADDAAGLTISEGMRSQVRGLDKASTNVKEALSFIQTADGALDSIQNILKRGSELSVQASNDTLTADDRNMIQMEIDELKQEIDYIHYNTEQNTIPVFQDIISESTATSLADEILVKLATDWVPNAVNAIYSKFPSLNNIGLNVSMSVTSSVQVPYGVIASMQVSYYTDTGEIVKYNLNIDMADIVSTNDTESISGIYYDQVIAHEMMHATMFGSMLGMTGSAGVQKMPLWFIEGSAEAVGGGLDRIKNIPNNTIQSQLGSGGITDYEAGYAAVMYIGYLAGGSNMNNIATGLDRIYNELINTPNYSLDQALTSIIGMGEAAFINNFKTDSNVTGFLDSLKAMNGAGSVIAPSLSTPGKDVIQNVHNNSQTSWIIDIDTQTYQQGNSSPLWIQSGANSAQGSFLNRFNVSSDALGISSIIVDSHQTATSAIETFNKADEKISRIRAYYGSKMNTYEHSVGNNDNTSENLSVAEALIRDTNMAKTMVDYAKFNILQQSAQAMMAQTTKNPENVLQLIRQ